MSGTKWEEKETPKGILKYRFPDSIEGYEFLAAIQTITNAQGVYKMKGTFIKMMQPLIDYSLIGYKSWDEFLSDKENNMAALGDIADLIYVDLAKALRKKN